MKEKDDIDVELTAADILAAEDTTPEKLEIPEWQKNGKPGVVYLKPLSAQESLEYTERIDGPARKNAMLIAIIQSVVNKNGERLFTDKDIDALKQKSIKVFNRIQRAVIRMNGLGPEVVEAAKNV